MVRTARSWAAVCAFSARCDAEAAAAVALERALGGVGGGAGGPPASPARPGPAARGGRGAHPLPASRGLFSPDAAGAAGAAAEADTAVFAVAQQLPDSAAPPAPAAARTGVPPAPRRRPVPWTAASDAALARRVACRGGWDPVKPARAKGRVPHRRAGSRGPAPAPWHPTPPSPFPHPHPTPRARTRARA